MTNLSNDVLSILAVTSVTLSVLALLLVIGMGVRSRRERARAPVLPDERLAVITETNSRSIKRLEASMSQLAAGQRQLAEAMQGVIQHVGIVRFDAFEDMGGRLSFSAALLDARGNGVVVTSINGRQDTRCYAKQVRGGTSIHNLSDEEEQAIREALGGSRQTVEAR